MTPTLSSIFHLCKDFQKSSEFYASLGFQELEPTQRSRRFLLTSSLELHLHGPLSRSEESSYGVMAGPVGASHVLSFSVKNVKELYDSVDGSTIVRPLASTPWGKLMFMVCDPDGFILEFQESPGTLEP